MKGLSSTVLWVGAGWHKMLAEKSLLKQVSCYKWCVTCCMTGSWVCYFKILARWYYSLISLWKVHSILSHDVISGHLLIREAKNKSLKAEVSKLFVTEIGFTLPMHFTHTAFSLPPVIETMDRCFLQLPAEPAENITVPSCSSLPRSERLLSPQLFQSKGLYECSHVCGWQNQPAWGASLADCSDMD